MAVIDIKINPTNRDLKIFSLLFLAFMALLGVMALAKPHALLVAAAVTGAAFVISILFNNDQPRKMQMLGLIIPLVLLAIGGLEKLGVSEWTVAGVTWGAGVVGAAGVLASSAFGKKLYTGWMYAALPVGWTISHLILGLIFYFLFTPMGLVMRLFGRDAMNRRFDRAATTYWIEHNPAGKPARYFRQF